MGVEEHREEAESGPVRCALLTVTDSRTEKEDESGRLARSLLEKAGHWVETSRIVSNSVPAIQEAVTLQVEAGIELIVTIGGTGPGRRDLTLDAIRPLFRKELPGFGEIFRRLSFDSIGPAAMLSGAGLGLLRGGTLAAALPGSPDAVRLALEKLLLPELRHLIHQIRK